MGTRGTPATAAVVRAKVEHRILDESMRDRPMVLVSAGRRGLELELAPGDLASLTGGTFAPLATFA